MESSCSVHSLPRTVLLVSFYGSWSLLLSIICLYSHSEWSCCANSNIGSLSGSYLAGWNGESSVCLNPSVKTGGGWLHTDSLIYLQPPQSLEWELEEYWEDNVLTTHIRCLGEASTVGRYSCISLQNNSSTASATSGSDIGGEII